MAKRTAGEKRWFEGELRDRLARYPDRAGYIKVSVKIRAPSTCFCPNCCPTAIREIEALSRGLERRDRDEQEAFYESHETGPEWIVYVAAGTVLISFTANVIGLVTACIKARSDGQKQGDSNKPVEVIIRGFSDKNFFDEIVMRLERAESATKAEVAKALNDALQKNLSAPKSIKPGKTVRSTKKGRTKPSSSSEAPSVFSETRIRRRKKPKP